MTAQNRATLKAEFEQGDKPQGSDYADLIDSFLSVADTTAQSVASKVTFDGGLAATTVSAAFVGNLTGNVTGNVTGDIAGNITGDLTGNVSGQTVTTSAINANSVSAQHVTCSAITVTQILSAQSFVGPLTGNVTGDLTGNVEGDVSAQKVTTSALTVLSDMTFSVDTTTAAAGGNAQTVPTTAAGYLMVTVSGATVRIPYFSAA